MNKVQKIHFVGIKGVGMTPLAIIAHQAKIKVTGSDIEDTFITDKALKDAGIKIFSGFSPDNIQDAELVIVTNAHGGYDNIEAVTAKQKNIPVISQAQAVGEFMNGQVLGRSFTGISVTGTHGKTTTSAMIATLFVSAKLEPSYLIGTSYIESLGLSGNLGKGKYFVAEADEYITESKYDATPKFLWQHPQILLMTNLEYDHPDVYPNLESVKNAFGKFVQQLPSNATLIICGDDNKLREVSHLASVPIITYGFLRGNDYIINSVQIRGSNMVFNITTSDNQDLGQFKIQVPGEHNVLNATAAMLVGHQAGLSWDDVKKHIGAFKGSKRRLEYIGESSSGAALYDDYGHHPTEINVSLQTLRKMFPKAYIVCVFQPHTFSRTQALFDDFTRAFTAVDFVLVTEIYASQREINPGTVSGAQLYEAIVATGKHAHFEAQLADVIEYIRQQSFPKPTVIVTMGAGDVYKILGEL